MLQKSHQFWRRYCPISDFYYLASKNDIREVLSKGSFECIDEEAVVNNATQWMRKRFAMLKDSDILIRFSAKDIQKKASNYKVKIRVVNDKIVFPIENRKAKKLLQFLSEEIFRGAITQERYETNSKKKTDW